MRTPKMPAPPPPPPPPAMDKEAMQQLDAQRQAEMLRRRMRGRASTQLTDQNNAYGTATSTLLGG